ncbi:hypothetical protein PFISCL1PPCAC_15424 [Pristionchus fissidentatus]|uniref:Gtl-1 n=1 Tax=Pristionchus fissidentatus TaxID=1538716 RepID=A0AAV5VWX5_9BILA|nr:hypothetical protein PFISCL1PPCAC_15424 [Pristionchus fissidentatus]
MMVNPPSNMDSKEVRIEMEGMNREDEKRGKKGTKRNSVDQPTMLSAPIHVHGNEWKDMITLANIMDQGSYDNRAFEYNRPRSNTKQKSWIEQNINKRECITFIPTHKYNNKCGCGRTLDQHSSRTTTENVMTSIHSNDSLPSSSINRQRWAIRKNTLQLPTDAYGTIHFEGGGHATEARYTRVAFDTPPETLMKLMNGVWRMKAPKLIITIHGGITDFDLQPKLGRALRRGIVKAAESTDTWIVTSGMNQGAVRHISEAIEDLSGSRKNKTCHSIGIAPWGLVKKRNRLVGENIRVKYNMNPYMTGKFRELNDSHSHFLLVDNGTVGRYGAEIVLRRRLETLLAVGNVPVVCIVIEGGAFSIKVVHDYLTTSPLIPVVICDGSGRASDLLAFTHQYIREAKILPDSIRFQLLNLVKNVFDLDEIQGRKVLKQIIECAHKKKLMNVFRLGEGINDIDHAIFAALIKGTKVDQLKLALTWNRVDIARTHIFGGSIVSSFHFFIFLIPFDQEWKESEMHEALMFALLHDRVEFVRLIMEKGVAMQSFLTFERLERLYNTQLGPKHTLYNLTKSDAFTLPQIGNVVEKLIGSAYRSTYTAEKFLSRYNLYTFRHQTTDNGKGTMSVIPQIGENGVNGGMNGGSESRKRTQLGIAMFKLNAAQETEEDEEENEEEGFSVTDMLFTFEKPFHELLIWAVLTKRQEIALTMWRYGEEGLAKALIATRLYKSLASNAADSYLDLHLCQELTKNGEAFRIVSRQLMDECYKTDEQLARSLLTCELNNWGFLTSLSIAFLNQDREFMKHPCCQTILTDMWRGAVISKGSVDWLIVGGIIIPPAIFLLEFKSEEEIQRQPHTSAEHESDDSSSDGSLSSDDSTYDSDDSEESEEEKGKTSRRSSIVPPNFVSTPRSSIPNSSSPQEAKTIQALAAHTLPGFLHSANVPPAIRSSSINNGVDGRQRSGTLRGKKQKKKESEESRRSSRSTSFAFGRKQSTMSIEESDSDDERRSEKRQMTPLTWTRKLYEFYNAPITTFWLWALMFSIFQLILVYILLLRSDPWLRWEEFFLFAFVLVYGCELARKFIFYKERPMKSKVIKFFFNFQNGTSLLAVITYAFGFLLRCIPSTLILGRIIIIMNSVIWSFKLVNFLSVHRKLGPYIKIASEMIPRTMTMITLLFVVMLSYGLVRQGITYPDEDWHPILIRNIFLKPYYMLYGEVYADEIDTCSDGIWDTHIELGIPISEMNTTDPSGTCVPGHWVSPLYMTVFMLLANVLLMNSMVACCTVVYEGRIDYSREIWLLERFKHVMEFDSTPSLPPPFTIITHIYQLIQYYTTKNVEDRKELMDNSLKTFLSPDGLKTLHRFESECLEEMERKKEWNKYHSHDEHLRRTANKTEQIFNKITSMSSVEESLRDLIKDVDSRIQKVENSRKDELTHLRSISTHLDQISGRKETKFLSTPRVFVRRAREEDVVESDEGGETRMRPSSGGRKHRHHNEYTTIADVIEGPNCKSNIHHPFPRRNRFNSEDVNSLLFSVSEGDEPHASDAVLSDHE